MSLVALDLPDDAGALPAWLEQRLVGPHLADLAVELAVIHATADPTPTLADVLGEQREAVLARGLGELPAKRLRQLLRHPALLPQLQELVLTEGGDYWQRLLQLTAEEEEALGRGRRRLEAVLSAGQEQHLPSPPDRKRGASPHWYHRPWLVSLGTAAALLMAVAAYDHFRRAGAPLAPTWGWARPGALPDTGPPDAYLNALADAAGDWFRERPQTPAELAGRLAAFRQGCSVLIFAEHSPLAEADRRWLVEHCRTWADRLDRLWEELEAGREVEQIREQADATVNTLMTALRTRARELAGKS
jgi:hypothetical protein